MKVQVSTASAPVLDWMVAKCEESRTHYQDYRVDDGQLHAMFCDVWLNSPYAPSTDWARGGPIIEREKIDFWTGDSYQDEYGNFTSIKSAKHPMSAQLYEGHTPLIAAMRCYVASKLGEEVEVPDGLR